MQITGKNLLTLKSSLERALDDCHTDIAHISSGASLEEDRLLEVSKDMDNITKLLTRCNRELEKGNGS